LWAELGRLLGSRQKSGDSGKTSLDSPKKWGDGQPKKNTHMAIFYLKSKRSRGGKLNSFGGYGGWPNGGGD